MSQTPQLQKNDLLKAKLFNLNEDSEWEDKGVGYPMVEKNDKEQGGGFRLVFYKENPDTEIVYQHDINSEIQYEQSEEKVVSWNSEKLEVDMAISFQNQVGSTLIWDRIQEALKLEENLGDDDYFQEFSNFQIQVPNYNNLETILQEVSDITADKRSSFAVNLANKPSYIQKFVEIFKKAEGQQDKERLALLCKIFKQIILLVEHELLETLLSDEFYLDIFGILEYEEDMQKATVTHREFLKNKAKFHSIIDFKENRKLQQIHLNYRLQYLKDCALGHFLDDRSNSLIQMISQTIYQELIEYISQNKEVLRVLAEKFRNLDIKALKFMHELFSAMKSHDSMQKQDVVESFSEVCIFEILIEDIFQNTTGEKKTSSYSLIRKKAPRLSTAQQAEVQKYCFEILFMAINYHPKCLQQYAISDNQKFIKYPFLTFLVENMKITKNTIKQDQCFEILRGLLNSETTIQNTLTSEVSGIFTTNYLKQIISVFEEDNLLKDEKYYVVLRYSLDIIQYLMKSAQEPETLSQYRIDTEVKINREQLEFLAAEVNPKIIIVFNLKNKYLVSKSLQIFKTFCELNNDEINKSLQLTVAPITQYIFKQVGRKQNLIFSQIMELIKQAYTMKLKTEEESKKYMYGQEQENSYYDNFEEEFLNFIKKKYYKFYKQMFLISPKEHKETENDVSAQRNKKNSECLSQNQINCDIDMIPSPQKSSSTAPAQMNNNNSNGKLKYNIVKKSDSENGSLPPIPTGSINIQGNQINIQDTLNLKRKAQQSNKLVDYEEDEDDEEEINKENEDDDMFNVGEEQLTKKVKVNEEQQQQNNNNKIQQNNSNSNGNGAAVSSYKFPN